MRVVFKELNETLVWLRIIELSELLKRELLVDIIQENGDLCRIFATSLKTARRGSEKISIDKSQFGNSIWKCNSFPNLMKIELSFGLSFGFIFGN